MKKAITPKTDLYVDKDLSPTIQPFIEYNVDPNLNESVHIIQKYFNLLNKKLSIGIGNMTLVIKDNGNMHPTVISILLKLDNYEPAAKYYKVIDNLNKQIRKYGCTVEACPAPDDYMLVKCLKYFDGSDPKKSIQEVDANKANMELRYALSDIW